MGSISESWQRIEKWALVNLEEDEFSGMPAGASESRIERAESKIGTTLPDDLRESYRLHNGSEHFSVFPYAQLLLSLDGLVKEWTMWMGHLDSGMWEGSATEPDGPIKPVHWSPLWIPFAGNGSGSYILVDLDPADGGVVGQVVKFVHEGGPSHVLSSSFGAYLEQYANGLETGAYRYVPEIWIEPVDGE